MPSSFVFDALVLHRYPVGEDHRGVVFLTREQGLLRAVAYGASKNKSTRKPLTSPFCRVLLKASYNQAKESWAVLDLEGKEFYQGISEDLKRYFVACLWAKLLIKTQGIGQPDLFDLFEQGYSLLGRCSLTQISLLWVQSIWRFFELSGLKPDFAWCFSCGKSLKGPVLYFDPYHGTAFCRPCSQGPLLSMPSRVVEILLMTEVMTLEESLLASLHENEVALATEVTKRMVEGLLDQSIKDF